MSNLLDQIKALCDEHQLPSLAVTVFDQDRVLDEACYGVRKLGESIPITLDDWFHIGSNGKAMTATMIAELVENGRLRYESTPLDIFPEWTDLIDPGYKEITLLQLLSHQAGLPPFEEDVEFKSLPEFEGTAVDIRREFALHILKSPPIHTPGSEFRYSNASFSLATTMAEKVSHEAWESMLHSKILRPLDIVGGVGWPAKADPHQPWGHILVDEKIEPHDPNDEYQLEPMIAPAGDVYVKFRDYTKFLQMNLNALAGKNQHLKAETVQFLHTPHGRAGSGWGHQKIGDKTVSAHTGSADTFFAIALLNDDDSMAISMVTNITWEVAEKPCITLLKDLLGV